MADSNITKRALAAALKELMNELPFEKISVAQICEKCDMNRKSFYYHFKDKYDLVNWIFDIEFIEFAQAFSNEMQFNERVDLLREVCEYFYKNRSFYKKALNIKGQNSFSEHLREYCQPILKLRLKNLIGEGADDEFILDFFTDAALCAIERWILNKNCIAPEELVQKLKIVIEISAETMYREINAAHIELNESFDT